MAVAFSGERFEVVNPRTGIADFRLIAPAPAEVAALAGELRAAQPAWRDAGLEHRIGVLQRWKHALRADEAALTVALSTDTGRYALAVGEVKALGAMIDRWCLLAPSLALEEETRASHAASLTFRSQYVPHGLVGVASPWNFPLSLALIDALPALLAGCAVLGKPSEVAPRFAEPLTRSIARVPELAAVLRVIPGGREAGIALIDAVDAVCFTGSVRTGRLVAEHCARRFIPAFLELGGKDPAIVCRSADLERATDIVLRGACQASGQACQSLERVYVDRAVHDRFIALLAAKASTVPINWPDPHAGVIGPFIWPRQAEIVAAQIADAVERGATVVTGGHIEQHGGKWLRPTVLANVDHSMTVMTEETFGPVMPVMAFDTEDEAIRLANEGSYGLSAAVIAGTLEEAESIGRRIDAGAISLNDGALTAVTQEAEKHSFKFSGLGGSRMGPAGYTRFFRRKALIRQTGVPLSIDALREELAAPSKAPPR
jgi:succinate-semialdehyde dehydrogenase / glutarate-semialdehyde dehydrogenase